LKSKHKQEVGENGSQTSLDPPSHLLFIGSESCLQTEIAVEINKEKGFYLFVLSSLRTIFSIL